MKNPLGINLSEDSPLEAPVATFNRHAKLMSPATRELVLRSRATEIEAFALDRGYDPLLVSAVAEVSMRTGRIPELRQYGFSGDDALAVKHFISGDVLNNYAEDLDEADAVAKNVCKKNKGRMDWPEPGHCSVDDNKEWERLLKKVAKALGLQIEYGDYGVTHIGDYFMHNDDGYSLAGVGWLEGPKWTKDGKFLDAKIIQAAKKAWKRRGKGGPQSKKVRAPNVRYSAPDIEAPGHGGVRTKPAHYAYAKDIVKALAQSQRARKASRYKEDEEAGADLSEERSSPEVMQKFYDLIDKNMQKIVALQDEPGELTRLLIRLAQQAGMDKLQALGPAVIHAAKYAKKGQLKRRAQGEGLDEDLKKQMLDSVLGLLKHGLEMHNGDKKKALAFAKKHSTAGPAIWKAAVEKLGLKESLTYGDYLAEVSPPGFSGSTEKLKKDLEKKGEDGKRAFQLMWAMYNKGAKPHIAPKDNPKGIKKYISPETYAKYKKAQ